MCTICAQLHPVQPDCVLEYPNAITVIETADAAAGYCHVNGLEVAGSWICA